MLYSMHDTMEIEYIHTVETILASFLNGNLLNQHNSICGNCA